MTVPNSRYAYISPTYKQSKNIAWDIIKEYARKVENTNFNESELRCDFANGSRITLYGSDNPDALRGMGLWGVVYDEYSQQPSNIHTEIILPALADHKGFAIWIGTPKGKNAFYELYEKAKIEDNWLGLLLTAGDSGIIDKSELEEARKVMTADEFQQEWFCSFEASIKGAYYAKEISEARKENRIKQVFYDKALKVHTVWDLGVGNRLAIGFYQKAINEIKMIDYWEGSNSQGIVHAIKECQNKPYIYGKHFAPHDIRAREEMTGKTRIASAKELGIEFDVVPKISVDNGIDKGRIMFSKLWIDKEKCQLWTNAIAQYHQEWDDNRGMFVDKPYHDWTSHASDVHRYASIVESEMTNEEKDDFIQQPHTPQSEYEGGEEVQTTNQEAPSKEELGNM